MNDMLRAWDAWVLQRSPVVWQLRLHRFAPLALLVLLVWWAAMLWMANPARWLGVGASAAAVERHQSPERQALELMFIVSLVVGMLQALWWLASTRVHNRWRDHLPASRFALWREWLWGALLCALLLAPVVLHDRGYKALSAMRWQGTPVDVPAQEALRNQVRMLETIVSPTSAPFLPHWDAVADLPSTTDILTGTEGLTPSLAAVRVLKHGDVDAIAQQIEAHARLLQAQGFVAADGGSARTQAQALVQAYRHNLRQHQAAWRAEVVRQAQVQAAANAGTAGTAGMGGASVDAPPLASWPHAGGSAAAEVARAAAQAAQAAGDDVERLPQALRDAQETLGRCRYPSSRYVDSERPVNCMNALAALPEPMRLDFLRQQQPNVDLARHAKWVHPRHGQAAYAFEEDHLRRLQDQFSPDDAQAEWADDPRALWVGELSVLVALAMLCALALLAVRLLSWGQIALLGASLVLTLMLSALLGALGLPWDGLPATLGLPLLGVGLWRVWRGRPWGDFVWLGCGLAVTLVLWQQVLRASSGWVFGWRRDSDWTMLLGWPGFAVGTLLLLAALAPVLRRWRSLAER